MKAIRHTIYLSETEAILARALQARLRGTDKATGRKLSASLSLVAQEGIRSLFRETFPDAHERCAAGAKATADITFPTGPDHWGESEPPFEYLVAHRAFMDKQYWMSMKLLAGEMLEKLGTDEADE